MRSPRASARERTVLFVDIGGVLIQDPPGIAVGLLEHQAGRRVAGLSKEYRRLSRRLDCGTITLREFHSSLESKFRLGLRFREFERLVLEDGLRPIPEVVKALREVKLEKRATVVALSNTSRYTWGSLVRRFGFHRLFDHEILSFRLGLLKPGLQIFRVALRRTKSNPASVVYLDDSAANVRAARSLGIGGTRIRRSRDSLRALNRLGPAPRRPITRNLRDY